MSRSVKPWKGATDDTPVPPRVRLRTLERKDYRCHKCGRTIRPGEPWTCEHLIAIINGGKNEEANLGVTCCDCLPIKNAADAAIKSRTAKIAKRTWLSDLKRKSRPMPGTRASGIRKRMNGTVESW
jgi:5-methylcytosine-specific restriction protein A